MSALSGDPYGHSAEKSRYLAAPQRPDFTLDQDWASYSAAEHDRWDRLFARAQAVLQHRACDEFLSALKMLQLSQSGIPDMEKLSARLRPITGWEVVPVAGLVPNEIFFDHLAHRRFPAGAFIRPEHEMDYLQEPDVFHDVFGHVPLLANPVYADFIQAYGEGGHRAMGLGRLANLSRLYWYTVEFGLLKSANGLRIFGAGILSSATESVFALEDPSPNRIGFDLERVMRTDNIIDDFQQSYFVIDSFDKLLEDSYRDFGPLYARLGDAAEIAPDALLPSDRVISRGTLDYFRNKRDASAVE
ncbi:phenylalanine 4-monooxygenase [soil metagenome]